MRIEDILAELKRQAGTVANEVDLDAKIGDAKAAAENIRVRIETDPAARNAAIGAGGLLLAGLLGTKGGRNVVGGLAKTGAVAALGAIAYKAWLNRDGSGAPVGDHTGDANSAGFGHGDGTDPAFSNAVLTAMVASAYADGVFDAAERERINMAAAGLDDGAALAAFRNGFDEARAIETIVAAARSPNQAAELFAAAAVMATNLSAGEKAFLDRLRDALGIAPAHADAILATARG